MPSKCGQASLSSFCAGSACPVSCPHRCFLPAGPAALSVSVPNASSVLGGVDDTFDPSMGKLRQVDLCNQLSLHSETLSQNKEANTVHLNIKALVSW